MAFKATIGEQKNDIDMLDAQVKKQNTQIEMLQARLQNEIEMNGSHSLYIFYFPIIKNFLIIL